MKVCTHQGLLMAVLTRNEHCPPHVHVGSADWEARFEFSFWHNGVRLWDVVPVKNQPSVTVLEGLRQALKKPQYLRQARLCWWQSFQAVCLVNQMWDAQTQEVVSPQDKRPGALLIQTAVFDALRYQTVLQLKGASSPVEIQL
ncbi:DUF4160 domain-containing protein [Rhodoferax antarcticus]|uniref:DUF4160 domain-containing protein n=2 Tax=Rhodoferax antarcticus TaxID=81479 RepID=UPI0022240661|nr:DUF4160 domain-containing protein [Rhodoferax antarcticus]MCW2314407.1 hypothetical protein [Rhodoferax antarcticus]